MVYRTRIKYTAAQRAEIWDRWQRGETFKSIARLFDRHHHRFTGHIWRRRAEFARLRVAFPRALTLTEREEISRGLAGDLSLRAIAVDWGAHPRRSAVR